MPICKTIQGISLLLEKLVDCDMVCARRQNPKDEWVKWALSFLANGLRNRLMEETIADIGCSPKAYRIGSIKNPILLDGMHRFPPILLKMEGYRVEEAPVRHRPRQYGKSEYNILNRLFSGLQDPLAVIWIQKRKLKDHIVKTKT